MKLSKKPMDDKAKSRRKRTLEQLEIQLKLGTKPNKFGTTAEKKADPRIPLTEKDKARIVNEIEVLKTRI